MPTPTTSLVKPGTQELLPGTRDAYLQNKLAPAEARTVEQLLENDSVERGVALARYHELHEMVGVASSPEWVHQQLLRQPSVSAWGPLRRPVLQVGLGLLLLLGGFSTVRWVRNQPLVPVVAVVAFERTVNSAVQSLGRAVVYTPADIAATLATEEPVARVAARPAKVPRPAGRTARPAGRRLASEPIAPLTAPVFAAGDIPDSLSQAGAADGKSTHSTFRLVRGYVYDPLGKPLAGATVLIKGTTQAAVTNAAGAYELNVPFGASLEIGYAGYLDETTQAGQETSVDVTLQPLSRSERRKVRGQ